jgi:4'-phosphopantetheinyl transferase
MLAIAFQSIVSRIVGQRAPPFTVRSCNLLPFSPLKVQVPNRTVCNLHQLQWKISRASIAGVDLWRFGYDVTVDERVLSDDERRVADRFATDVLRHRYVVAHAVTRELLAPYTGTAAADLVFARGPRGKPSVAGIEHNLSHCDDLVLLAVARVPVGVDVERVDVRRDEVALSRVVRAPDEADMPFLRVWCRKEAYLKAIGVGLVDDLTAISVRADRIGDVALYDLAIDGHVAALAATSTSSPPARSV